jgi:hypothetical protein
MCNRMLSTSSMHHWQIALARNITYWWQYSSRCQQYEEQRGRGRPSYPTCWDSQGREVPSWHLPQRKREGRGTKNKQCALVTELPNRGVCTIRRHTATCSYWHQRNGHCTEGTARSQHMHMVRLADTSALKMEAVCSCETSRLHWAGLYSTDVLNKSWPGH